MAILRSASIETRIVAAAALEGQAVAGELVQIKAFNQGLRSLSGSSTPPVSLVYAAEIAFEGSSSSQATQTIDLSAFEDIEGVAQDAEGLRVRAIQVVTAAENIGEVTIGPASADGYPLFGAANEVDVPPGAELLFYLNNGAPVVSGDGGTLATDIDVVGYGGDTAKVLLLLG